MAKRVLMLAWEYPPKIVGGLARVVYALSRELAAQDCEVHVVTADAADTPEHELDGGVYVHRVKNQTDWTPDFVSWVPHLNFGILQHAIKLQQETPFDIIHAHDWLVAQSAWVMKTSFNLPLITNIHATEQGRSKGLHNDVQRYINQMEWRLIYESQEVVVNSRAMVEDLHNQLWVPREKVSVIANGIYPDRFASCRSREDLRRSQNIGDGPVVLFVGRLVREKGVQVLLDAAPAILEKIPNANFIIAGTGGYGDDLRAQAERLNLGERVRFFGHANDDALCQLYGMADVCVVPSLYEPFGIVVLEGMAAGVPVVTSNVGGINDIVEHLRTAVKTHAEDAGSLGWGILEVLQHPELAERLKHEARQEAVQNYSWSAIAHRISEAYDRVIAHHRAIAAR